MSDSDSPVMLDHTRLTNWQASLSQTIGSHSGNSSDETLYGLISQLGMLLQADRCFLIQLLDNEALPVKLEYTSGPEIFPYKGLTPPWGLCPFLRKTAGRQFACTTDALEDVSVKAVPMLHTFFKEKGVRGGIGCPVIRRNKLTDVLVLHTAQPREWQEDELSLVRFAAGKIADYLEIRK